jgi:hypothetical protein
MLAVGPVVVLLTGLLVLVVGGPPLLAGILIGMFLGRWLFIISLRRQLRGGL